MIRITNTFFSSFEYSLLSKIRMMYTRQIRDIQELRQRSHIAQIIMGQIEKNRSFKEIKQKSLTQHIIDNVEKQKHIDPKVRKEMLQFFKQGIKPDFQIFKQKRHGDQIYNFQIKNDPKKNKLQNVKIRYFPTTLISGQIFSDLIYGTEQYQILTGHSGISKSLSVQLFWHLSNIICEYRCKEKSIQRLKQNELIQIIPKLIYWNVLPKQTLEQTRLKILKQCFQIGENLENTNYLTLKSNDDFTKFYAERGINVILLIDQFNLLVNLHQDLQAQRLFNQSNSLIGSSKNQMTLSYNLKFPFLQNCFLSLQNIRKNSFSRYIYLSSVQIQTQRLKYFDINFSQGNTGNIDFKRLRFEDLVYTPMALYQLIDYFMFELKQKFNIPSYQIKIYNDQTMKQKIRDLLYDRLKTQTNQVYLTPLLISLNLRKNIENQKIENFKKILEKKNQDQFTQNIVNQLKILYQSCLQYSQKYLIQKVKTFTDKGSSQSKKAILSQLFDQSYMKKKINRFNDEKNLSDQTQDDNRNYQKQPKYMFEINADNIANKYYSDQMKQINDLNTQKIQSNLNKQLFYYNQNEKKIYSYFQYPHIQKYLGKYHQDTIEWMMSYSQQKIKKIQPKVKDGNYFENFFIETISSGHINLSFPQLNIEFQNIYGKKLGFVPIPSANNMGKNFCFLNKFRYPLENLPSKDHQVFPFVPLQHHLNPVEFLKRQKQIQLNHIDDNSRVIDLILAYTPKYVRNPITLFAFDLTISADPSKIQTKLSRFLQKYKRFMDKDTLKLNGIERKVQMKYYVISALQDKSKIQNILDKINQSNDFIFTNSPYENQLIVDSKKIEQKLYSPLLSSIGHIYMGKEKMVLKKASPNNHISVEALWYFDRLGKSIKSLQEKNKQNSFNPNKQD